MFAIIITPLLIAGLIRVFTDKYPILPLSLDFGLHWNNKPLIGESKTWQGLIVMTFVSWIIGAIIISKTNLDISIHYGFWLGICYNIGEIINSFIKRRIGIMPSQSTSNSILAALQYVIDQIDGFLIIGLYVYALNILNWPELLQLLIIGFVIHLIIDALNTTFGSKTHTSQYNLHSFWQIVMYVILWPFRVFFSSNILITHSQTVIISNHVSKTDFLKILLSIPLSDYLRFVPFGYVINSKYNHSYMKILINITGGISNQQESFFALAPIEKIITYIDSKYSLLWFWEGRVRKHNTPLLYNQFGSGLYYILTHYDSAVPLCVRLNSNTHNPKVLHQHVLNITSKKDLLNSCNQLYYSL